METLDRQVAESYARSWGLFVLTGVLWLLLGFVLLSYRVSSISVAVVFIAVVFWMGALSLFALSVVAPGGWRLLTIIGGIVAVAAGIGALVWPAPTLLVVSIFVAWYLLINGIVEVAISLSNTDVRGWWLSLVAGIFSIGLGAWAIGNPDRSVLLLVTIIGLYAIFHGVSQIMAGFDYRELGKDLGVS